MIFLLVLPKDTSKHIIPQLYPKNKKSRCKLSVTKIFIDKREKI